MKKILLIPTLLVTLVFNGATTTTASADPVIDEQSHSSPSWSPNASAQTPTWFKEINLNNSNSSFKDNTLNNEGSSIQYNFVHKEGNQLSEKELLPFITGEIEVLEDENNHKSHLVAIGTSNSNGQTQTDFYFSNIKDAPISDIKEYATEVAQKNYNANENFKQDYTSINSYSNNAIVAAVPSGTNYIDTFHWIIYSDQEKLTNGNFVVAGFIDSTVTYTKQGTATINSKNVSVWDMKASTQTRPVNSYQTRQIASRHTIEPYVPDQRLLSYGPTTTKTGSNFSVSLTGGFPSISWNFSRDSVDVTDTGSLSTGYGKWTFDFPLGKTVAKGSFLMEPGIRITNETGMVKFQHSHSGYYYKNLSYQGNGVSGLVSRSFNDL
ncbi:hypothetical protein [Paenibacillus sp. FSL H8-0283]|uniref:hypothetical protein n=1 Tax=Paenibacillus sp. FSL H8-0283 TaxID=2921383 RepID=UPI003250AE3D